MTKVSAGRVVTKRPNWQLKLLSQAIAVAGAGMQASTVLAHPCPANPVHGAKTTTCFVADGDTATINAGGSIIVTDGPAIQFVGPGTKTVVNSGTLTGTTAAIQDQDPPLSGGTVTITNNAGAAINGVTTGIYINVETSLNDTNNLTLTNNGTIQASSSERLIARCGIAAACAAADGIYISGNLTSSITNGGTISGTVRGGDSTSASAGGIYVFGFMSGTLNNTGTISATATSAGADSDAVGIAIGGPMFGGTLTNETSGEINVTADRTGTSVSADPSVAASTSCRPRCRLLSIDAGIFVGSSLYPAAALVNKGTITVTATADGESVSAYGIFIGGEIFGVLDNSGTIDVTATAGNADASAFGIYVSSTIASSPGAFTNSGHISVTASAPHHAFAVGVFSFESAACQGSTHAPTTCGRLQGSFDNSGTITVKTHGASSSHAVGIHFSSMQSGSSLTNSGTITATADRAGTASGTGAAGIVISFLSPGATLTNSGTINADTGEGPGTGWAMIVRHVGSFPIGTPVITNSGTMNGNVFLVGSSLNNAGTVSIPRSTGAPGTFSVVGGDFTQTGTGVLRISAFSLTDYGRVQVNGVADFSGSGRLAVNVAPLDQLVAGGVLQNVVSYGTLVGGGNLSVTDNSAAWDFAAVDDGHGGIDLTIAGHTVRMLAARSVQVANVNLDELSSVVMGRMVTGRLLLVERGSHDQNLWFRPYGTTGSQDDDNGIPGYDIDTHGLVIGYDNNLTEDWKLGAAFAYSKADIKAKGLLNDKIDTDFYQGAVYAYWQGAGHDYVDLMAIYGTNSNDSTRDLGNGARADGNYDGWYTRVSSAIGKGFPLSNSVTLIPSASVSYTYVKEDGYNESGAGASNLNVDSNDASSLIFGLDGQIAFSMGTGALLTAHIGAGYDALTDDTSLTSNFLGGPHFTTEGNKPDEWLGRAGVGAEVVAGDRIEMHVNYEYEYRDDFTDNLLAATLRWKI